MGTIECGTVGTHQSGDVRADDLQPHFLFKGPEYGFIVEGSALHYNMAAKLFGRRCPNDLINGVFYNGNRQSRRNIFNGGAILLCLLHTGVHEYRTPAAKVNGPVGKQPQLCKFLYVIAQCLCKGL